LKKLKQVQNVPLTHKSKMSFLYQASVIKLCDQVLKENAAKRLGVNLLNYKPNKLKMDN